MKKRIPMIMAMAILAGMIALNICVPEPVLEPDRTYPMANARISWLQTYYGGAWNSAD